MLRHNRIICLTALAVLVAMTVASRAQDPDPYSLLTASYSPDPANYIDEVTLHLTGPLPNSCFGHSPWGIPRFEADGTIIEIPVLVSFCGLCVTPSSPFEFSVPIGQVPPGERPIVFRIVEEIHCIGGDFDSVSYDTAFVYDTLQIGTIGCPDACDINGDFAINIADVVSVIRVAFRGEPSASNPCNPMPEDINCDLAVDVLDAILIVNSAFRAAPCPGC